MKDNTRFRRITFDTNPHDCNLHCVMCEHHSRYSTIETQRIILGQPKEQMPVELIRRVLESTKGSALREIIPSTMGEPLLYKNFEQIIDLCKEFGVKLNLTTNGTFPIKGATVWAKIIASITSDVKISWNGSTKATQEKIMLGSNFEQGLQNIKDFLRVRNEHAQTGGNYCQVTLQPTFMETNLNELEELVELAISLGIDRVKGHHLWVNFPQIESLSLRKNQESISKWNEVVLKIKKIADENLLPNGKHIMLVNFDVLESGAIKNLMPTGTCPFLNNEAWIATNGHFSPCCAPDILRKKLGDFGNVNDKDILDIWHSEEYRKLAKNYMNNDVCISCNMRRLPDNITCADKENKI